MRVHQAESEIRTAGPGLTEVTALAERELAKSGLSSGLATVFCPHTSCSLVLMENASPEARADLQSWLERLVPPERGFAHDLEGPDDMPAHIKMALTRSSENVPFAEGRLLLGAWQGIYLWEHRRSPHRRTLHFSFIGA
ncbi:MAG TPA: secondary thiamine-phosphate synthase enzyme YjbQ [Opitutaceae bacterium]|nr:secondary thiamine-phosphate synthase enzyme YjbQ [Opitutaceae bacterium]